jgi:acyl-CoA thioesterase
MSVSIAFHDDAPIDQWLLYDNPAIWAGRGLTQGDGKIFTQDGVLLASYSVQAMIREFVRPPEAMGMDATNAM